MLNYLVDVNWGLNIVSNLVDTPLDSNQQALADIVKDVTKKGHIELSQENAETILDWAEEYRYPTKKFTENKAYDR
jgi:hypothetical protein